MNWMNNMEQAGRLYFAHDRKLFPLWIWIATIYYIKIVVVTATELWAVLSI